MNGVEILTSEEIVVNTIFNWEACWITFVAVYMAMFVISVIIKITNNFEWYFVPIMTIVCGIFGGGLFGFVSGEIVFPSPSEYETQYKVVISDEVSMDKFLEQYKIIKQDGKIYTVREIK